ncbi:MAG: hypothetical protein ACXVFQ_21950 [Solirubrobacteraceae bacterium]
MHAGLQAIGWGLPRLALALGVIVLAVLLAYCVLVFAIVVVQAVAAFGQ